MSAEDLKAKILEIVDRHLIASRGPNGKSIAAAIFGEPNSAELRRVYEHLRNLTAKGRIKRVRIGNGYHFATLDTNAMRRMKGLAEVKRDEAITVRALAERLGILSGDAATDRSILRHGAGVKMMNSDFIDLCAAAGMPRYISEIDEAPCDHHSGHVYSYRFEGEDEDSSEPVVVDRCPKCVAEDLAELEVES